MGLAHVAVALVSALALAAPLRADSVDYATAHLDRRLPAVQAAGEIAVDGRLDEAAWAQAPVAAHFIQSEPKAGEPASEDTEVRVLYDDRNLYFGVFAHDRAPGGIIVNELTKDFALDSTDLIEIVLDTFRDERNGYVFAVNAAGAKWDAQMVNEGREVNPNWDGVWDAATRVARDGWYAEISIPFRTLKFTNMDPQTWGINFMRRIRRVNEDSAWSPIPRLSFITRVSLAGTLEELRGLRPGSNLKVKPYVLAGSSQVAGSPSSASRDVGLDVKLGVTSGLTWDFTVNTDFSQVEADEQQINLTRVSLLFPEKRDFFLENSGVFQFGPGNERAATGSNPMNTTIGANETTAGRPNRLQEDVIAFFSRRIGLSDDGRPIRLLGGSRLTGRVGGFTVGVLNIQQREESGQPSTNFTAVRLRRNVLANSDVGALVLNKQEAGGGFNRVVGGDVNLRFFRALNFNGFAARSFSPASAVPGAGEETTARVSMNYLTSTWEIRNAYTRIGDRFNDAMGFVPRVGIWKFDSYVGPHLRPTATRRWVRQFYPHWQLNDILRNNGSRDTLYHDYHFKIDFQDGSNTEFGLNPSVEAPLAPFVLSRRQKIVVPPGRYSFTESFIVVSTNKSAPLSGNARYGVGTFYNGYRHSYILGSAMRVNEQLNVSLSLNRNVISLPAGALTTNVVAGRVNYSFSTQMFVNALLQYNSDTRQLSSNVRFNFIYRPLSNFYLVYNDQRDPSGGSVLSRALVAKFTYLMSF